MLFRIATWLVPLTIAIVFHEVAHGATARHFGDMTAAKAGRLTLNPLRHVDPFGTVILPLMLAVSGAPVFGWAKGVPINPNRLRNPRWHMVLVALAGPVSNLVMALISAILFGFLVRILPDVSIAEDGFLATNLKNFIMINLFLATFNMLPLPPFDGSRVLGGLLPPKLAAPYRRLDRYGLFIMLGLLVVLPRLSPSFNVIGTVVVPPVETLLAILDAIVGVIAGRG
jgi:Zn-dependent protease